MIITNKFVVNSDCTRHVGFVREKIIYFKSENNRSFITADKKRLTSRRVGNIAIDINSSQQATLKDVLCFSELQNNLLTVKRTTEKDFNVTFDKDNYSFTKNNETVLKAELNNNLFEIESKDEYRCTVQIQVSHVNPIITFSNINYIRLIY